MITKTGMRRPTSIWAGWRFNEVDGYYDKRHKYGADSFRDMYFAKEEVVELNPPNEWRKVQINSLKKA